MLKRITFALGLIGISFSAVAGAPGNNMAIPSGTVLTAPDSDSGWSFGIEGMYVQPLDNNFQYVQVNNNNQSVGNSYQWGGAADITYHFDGNSRDVTLGYTHLDSSDSDTTNAAVGEMSPPVFVVDDATYAKGEINNDYNVVDLTFGQQFLIGDRLVLHPFGGLRYADIDQDDKGIYSNPAIAGDEGSYKLDSDFQGAGPRAGMDVRVLTGTGFSIVGTVGGSLLVGNTDSHLNTYPSSLVGFSSTQINNDDATHLVPELDARVGLDYTPHKIFPAASMAFQVGYEVVHYFNVTNLNTWDTALVNSVNNDGNFAYQGPYLRLQLNVA